jgi:tight adherence protein C
MPSAFRLERKRGVNLLEMIIILTFVSITGLIYTIVYGFINRDRQIKYRLARLHPVLAVDRPLDPELERPLWLRLFGPVVTRLGRRIAKLTPQNTKQQAEKLLEQAGHPGNLTVNEYLAIKMVVILTLPGLVYWFGARGATAFGWLNVAAAAVLALILPDFSLKRAVAARQMKITAALPDTLDLLTVSVEAGLGFDQALLKIVEKTKGPLTDECKRVLQEVRIGKTRRDALRELGCRAGVEDLQTFVAAIIQADQLGVSIGNVLRIQSQQLRQKRRQKAEARAQKAPVKMLIPMILFIFPSLFIILLGPGVLQLIDNFSKMK